MDSINWTKELATIISALFFAVLALGVVFVISEVADMSIERVILMSIVMIYSYEIVSKGNE
ncbi:MAG: hypothetical protein ACYTBJ_21325 [Planctomycetota bacterium]|jgi:hypothetical protein